jgi:hypothetical protein
MAKKKVEMETPSAAKVMNERPCEKCRYKASDSCEDCGPEHKNFYMEDPAMPLLKKVLGLDDKKEPVQKDLEGKIVTFPDHEEETVKYFKCEKGKFKFRSKVATITEAFIEGELDALVQKTMRPLPKFLPLEEGFWDDGYGEIYRIVHKFALKTINEMHVI